MHTASVQTKTMTDFRPFRAWRYDPEALDINQVIAPPYDVISPQEQEELYQRSPYNCIRLILNKIEESDTDQQNRYTRAKSFYDKWRQEKKVVQENIPSFYFYRQTYQDPRNGKLTERTAMLGLLHLEPFDREIVIPHEKTLSKPRADRRKLLEATQTNFSPIFGLYEDPAGEVSSIRHQVYRQKPLFEAADEKGVKHALFVVNDSRLLEQIQKGMASRKIYIADGHHRYQTALEYGLEKRKIAGDPAEDQPYDFVYMALVEFNDPGLILLPTHRMILPYAEFNAQQMLQTLEPYFNVEAMPLEKVEKELQKNEGLNKVIFGLVLANQTYLLTLQNLTAAKKVMIQKPDVWYDLDVNILAHLIFKLWKIDESMFESVLRFSKFQEEAVSLVQKGTAQAAFLLKAPPVSVLREMGKVRELMPQKSTYFHPKLASGLLFYSH